MATDLQNAQFCVDLGHFLLDALVHLLVQALAMAIHCNCKGTEILDPETIQGFGVQMLEIDVFDLFYLFSLQSRSAPDNGKIHCAILFHGIEAVLVEATLSNDGTHAILSHEQGREAFHTGTGGGANTDFFPLVSYFAQAGCRMDTGHALKAYGRGVPLVEDVDLRQIAQTTAGFTGADLENLLNEAAILAAKDNRVFIQQQDIRHAFVKVGIGPEKKSRIVSEKERRITAYHEAGHAILFHTLPDVGPVYSVSIIPTGGAGGYTMPLPEKDDMFNTKGHMLQEITVALGGRVAEEEIFDDITTGASQDIKQATAIAKSMITKFGMSERLGLINYDNDSDEVFIGRDFGHTSRGYGEKVAGTIDEEVKRIIDECYAKARKIIQEHHDVLDKCAKLLLEKEKITRSEFEALFDEDSETKGAGK